MIKLCKNCEYYREATEGKRGHCHRSPPVNEWPVTDAELFCGEWQPGYQEIDPMIGEYTAKDLLRLLFETPDAHIAPGRGENIEPLRKKIMECLNDNRGSEEE